MTKNKEQAEPSEQVQQAFTEPGSEDVASDVMPTDKDYAVTEKIAPDAEETATTKTEEKAEEQSDSDKKYAGKYNSVEDLEKAYSEANKELQRVKSDDTDKQTSDSELADLRNDVKELKEMLVEKKTVDAEAKLKEENPFLSVIEPHKVALEKRVANGELTPDEAHTELLKFAYNAGIEGKGVSDAVDAGEGFDPGGTPGRASDPVKKDTTKERAKEVENLILGADTPQAFTAR